jgi:pimeloyl-ACP methyl ester carboxylesterase
LLLFVVVSAECQINYGSNSKAGKFIAVNDVKVYYEVYGKGEPLILLHGNSGSIGTMRSLIPDLARHFKVIAVDSRAQGKSTDSDKEITYALMASDMSELIDKLKLGSVHVVGWSDGGNIGLELALAHPEKVKKLVTFGANYTNVNIFAPPDSIAMDPNDPRMLKTVPAIAIYKAGIAKLTPVVRKKLADLIEKYPNITKDQLKHLSVPTLIVAGDHDIVNIEQTLAMFTNIPHAQLFIAPGASHLVPIEHPAVLNDEVIRFLTTPFRDIGAYYWLNLIQ